MTASHWYVDVDFIASRKIADDVEFDVLDVLSRFHPVFSTSRDRLAGGLSISMESHSALAAAAQLNEVLRPVYEILGEIKIVKVDVMDEEVREKDNATPSIPDLVGYAEIADMAGVSRQRAREIANLSGFPDAVVETASGPLRVKAAVEKWLSSWTRAPGRPRKVVGV